MDNDHAPAAHIRNSRNWIGAYPNPKQIDGELVIDVAPFTHGPNIPAPTHQTPDPLAPRARGPHEPDPAGELA